MKYLADRSICHIMDEDKNWQNFDLEMEHSYESRSQLGAIGYTRKQLWCIWRKIKVVYTFIHF